MTFRRGLQISRTVVPPIDVPSYLSSVLGVDRYVVRGDEYVISCPLPFGLHQHGDREPSAALNARSLLYNCFVCGGGDVLWLTQTVLDVSRQDALRVLTEHADGGSVVERLQDLFTTADKAERPLPSYSMRVVDSWACVVPYLTERGVSEEVQRRMRTGLNPTYREMVDGRFVEQPRVIIPHIWKGTCVGWQARRVSGADGPKYRASPSFPKSVTLYNADHINHREPVIVVESPMSALVLMSHGMSNVVATFGASITKGQLSLLADFDELVLWFDGDYAGQHATVTTARALERLTKVWVVDMGLSGQDPGDLDAETSARMYQNKVPSIFIRGGTDVVRETGRGKGPEGEPR